MSPDGIAPDLSGEWLGIGERGAVPWPGSYQFNLQNSCLAWVGRSAEEGEEVGASWTNVLLGRVNSDFTITGDWAVVSIGEKYCEETPAQCSNSRGTLTLKIDFVETAQGERVRLVLQALTMLGTSNAGIGSFPTGIWVRPGDEVLFDLSVN